jgi:hypothetical protein
MTTFRSLLYLVAIATCLTCTVLLFRGYLRRRIRLLMWSALCFAALTASNVLLFVDLVVFPGVDLRPARLLAALTGILLMLYAFIWEAD